ncbi:MAG: hypothetical protein D6737_06955 [Chloroflexi bacterium]|nr:MAG: hypothetical protein CUN54_00915 [Phototrophicales bacterium]RMF80772.1 MAG: hypothetical protein D6737_06955 [Chloroflexota bacterium]
MPLESMTKMLAHARRNQYAVGYFEAWDSYSLEAVAEAAEAERAPIILGFGCVMVADSWLDNGGIERLGCWGRHLAEQLTVPAAFILNETRTYEQALRGIDAGFNAVMVDTSAWDTHKAQETVAKLVEVAHAQHVAVEAELGRLPDAQFGGGVDYEMASLTNPEQAAHFVAQTGVDCLGVSIGNIHILEHGYAPVDLSLLEQIHQYTDIPLVIHGGTSFPPDAIQDAIRFGVAKFNVGTILKTTFLDGVRETIENWPEHVHVHDVLGSHKATDFMTRGQAKMRDKVRELIRLYGGSGFATQF